MMAWFKFPSLPEKRGCNWKTLWLKIRFEYSSGAPKSRTLVWEKGKKWGVGNGFLEFDSIEVVLVILGAGFKYVFIFHPKNWGRWTHFDEHLFQMGWWKTIKQYLKLTISISSRKLGAKPDWDKAPRCLDVSPREIPGFLSRFFYHQTLEEMVALILSKWKKSHSQPRVGWCWLKPCRIMGIMGFQLPSPQLMSLPDFWTIN